jgi:adenylate kinase family enzyme
MDLRRVAVVGTSCAGKTTFAAALAGKLQVPHIELDALHWRAGWVPASPENLQAGGRDRHRGGALGERWQL